MQGQIQDLDKEGGKSSTVGTTAQE